MALKDWKKLRGHDMWEGKEDMISVGRVKERYRVVSIYEGWEKYFKSKSSALAYAKSYMRSH
jgi:hypothetical protein